MIQFLALILLFAASGSDCAESTYVKLSKNSSPEIVTPKKAKKIKDHTIKKRKKGDLRKTINPTAHLSELGYNELKIKRDALLAQGDKETALKYSEKMIPLCDDLNELAILTLEIADLLYEMANMEKAGKMYRQFADLYPGNARVEYALYRAITCNFKMMYDAEHDQTRTQEVIHLADRFLEKSTIYTTYTNEVAGIRTQCYQRLFDHETTIVTFYLDQGKLRSAQTRLTNTRKEFVDLLPSCEQKLLELEIECAMRTNNIAVVNEKSQQLAAKFPTTKTAVASAEQQNRRSAMQKF